jgi:hypothetical protein
VFSDEAITATLDLAPLRELRDVLGRVSPSPEVTALADALDAIDRTPPASVYSLRYKQTAASVAEATRRTKNELRKLDLVEQYVPWGLVVLSVVVLVGVGVGRWRRRPTERPGEARPPEPTPRRRERAPA